MDNKRSIDLYIKDKATGEIRRIGDDVHDQMTIDENGELHYHNLQNGEGCRTGTGFIRSDYEFVPNTDMYGYNFDPRPEENIKDRIDLSDDPKKEILKEIFKEEFREVNHPPKKDPRIVECENVLAKNLRSAERTLKNYKVLSNPDDLDRLVKDCDKLLKNAIAARAAISLINNSLKKPFFNENNLTESSRRVVDIQEGRNVHEHELTEGSVINEEEIPKEELSAYENPAIKPPKHHI